MSDTTGTDSTDSATEGADRVSDLAPGTATESTPAGTPQDAATGGLEAGARRRALSTGAGLTDQTRIKARQIIARYPKTRSALLPMLHLVQGEEGYVSPAGIALCAEELGLTRAEVGAVATFYTMYKRRPCGDWLVSVCTNLSCQITGGEEIYAALSEHLGVGHDETTADGTITLEHAECLAACDYAPVITVNYEFFDNATVSSAMQAVADLQAGARPMPTRGEPLVTFREISHELAGFRGAGGTELPRTRTATVTSATATRSTTMSSTTTSSENRTV